MARYIAIAALLGALLQAPLLAEDLYCIPLSYKPWRDSIPIGGERIVRVPEQNQLPALHLLNDRTYLLLSQHQLIELLGSANNLSAEQMLSHQAADAESKATRCRKFAALPAFAGSSERVLEYAKSFDEYATYTNSLSRELHPYLVKGKVLFEGTGGFSAYLKGRHLEVDHGSLGRGPAEPKDVAIVVFTEVEVDNVSVRYSAAE